MLALKAFVHEAVRELDAPQLQLLSETLRIDLRGCEDREDIERVVTGLICLDQDTSLGKRASTQMYSASILGWEY